MLFLAANRIGETAFAVKLVFVTIEAVGIGTLIFILRAAGRPPEQILLYAWHPLPHMGDRRFGACRRGGRCMCRLGACRRRQRAARLVGA